jgi:hypothetical protein
LPKCFIPASFRIVWPVRRSAAGSGFARRALNSTLTELRNDPERSQSGAVKVALIPGMTTPMSKNAEVHMAMRELRPQFRNACLQAFLASEDHSDSRYFAHHFSLSPGGYPVELHP